MINTSIFLLPFPETFIYLPYITIGIIGVCSLRFVMQALCQQLIYRDISMFYQGVGWMIECRPAVDAHVTCQNGTHF